MGKLAQNVQHVPVVHVPRISERDDTLLHQIPQILDRRAGAAAVARPRANRREERARGVGEQALSVPLARDGRRRCGCRHHCGGPTRAAGRSCGCGRDSDSTLLLLWLGLLL